MPRAELSIADAIRATRPVDGVTLWLLGNAGVLLVEASGRRIAIDPWTSPWLETASVANPEPVVRQRPARLRSEELAEFVDAVLVTHEHPDGYASSAYPQLSVLLPGRAGVHLPPLPR